MTAANYDLASQCLSPILAGMNSQAFFYVYILTSLASPDRHYTGLTGDLGQRLAYHNAGKCPHTSKFTPWQIETAIAFRSREKAARFEKYMKSASGRAFAKRHF